jgi:hypothetical protein
LPHAKGSGSEPQHHAENRKLAAVSHSSYCSGWCYMGLKASWSRVNCWLTHFRSFPSICTGTAAVCKEPFRQWAEKVPTHSTETVYSLRGCKHPSLKVFSKNTGECGKEIEDWLLHWKRQNEATWHSACVSALSLNPEVDQPVGGRRLGKFNNPWHVSSEISVLPSRTPHIAERQPCLPACHGLRALSWHWFSDDRPCSLYRGWVIDHHALHCQSSLLLQLLSGYSPSHHILLFSRTNSWDYLPPRYCGKLSQASLKCYFSLLSGTQNSSVSNNRYPLKKMSGYEPWVIRSDKRTCYFNASLRCRNHCHTKYYTGFMIYKSYNW